MLAIFSSSVAKAPEELIQAADRSPTLKKPASSLVDAFLDRFPSTVSIRIGPQARILCSRDPQNFALPRSLVAKDEIFCLFVGGLKNLGSLRKHYGLEKNAKEAVLAMEAYKTLRDRAPYLTNHMLAHLDGDFIFVVFDMATSTVFVASMSATLSNNIFCPCNVLGMCIDQLIMYQSEDRDGKVPLFLGITAEGCLAFSEDAELLKDACGKSLASFPPDN